MLLLAQQFRANLPNDALLSARTSVRPPTRGFDAWAQRVRRVYSMRAPIGLLLHARDGLNRVEKAVLLRAVLDVRVDQQAAAKGGIIIGCARAYRVGAWVGAEVRL